MGRKQKVTQADIYEDYVGVKGGPLTLGLLAKYHKVTKRTIVRRMREVQVDGVSYFPTRHGYILAEERFVTPELADLMLLSEKWFVNMYLGQYKIIEANRKSIRIAEKKTNTPQIEKKGFIQQRLFVTDVSTCTKESVRKRFK